MTPPAVLSLFAERGLKLAVKQGQLFVEPKHRLNDETRVLIREHKPEILAALASQAADLRCNLPRVPYSLSALMANAFCGVSRRRSYLLGIVYSSPSQSWGRSYRLLKIKSSGGVVMSDHCFATLVNPLRFIAAPVGE